MMKRKLHLVLLIFALGFFILSGCAHQKANTPLPPSDPPVTKPVSQNREISSSEETQSNPEEKDDVLDEFERMTFHLFFQ